MQSYQHQQQYQQQQGYHPSMQQYQQQQQGYYQSNQQQQQYLPPYSADQLPAYDAENPEVVEHDAKVLIDSFIHSVDLSGFRAAAEGLPHPFALPQLSAGFDTPFVRGYCPTLQSVGITEKVFIDFVDGMNTAMISSPPLQVVNAAGMLLGNVPHWTFQLAATLMQTGAQVGTHVLSKTLSDRYLRAANERIFAPAGLRARLCKTAALRVLVDHPESSKEEPSKLKSFGRGFGEAVLSSRLPMPLTKKGIRFLLGKAPTIDASITDPVMRRMALFQGYTLPPNFNVPPPVATDGAFNKMQGYAVGKRRDRLGKKADDATARRQILAGMPVTREGGMSKRDKKMMKDVAKGKDIKKLKRKVEDDNRAEHSANEKVIWLVILNEADDHKIQGLGAMDDSSNNVTLNDKQFADEKKANKEAYGDSSSDDDELEEVVPSGSRSGKKNHY